MSSFLQELDAFFGPFGWGLLGAEGLLVVLAIWYSVRPRGHNARVSAFLAAVAGSLAVAIFGVWVTTTWIQTGFWAQTVRLLSIAVAFGLPLASWVDLWRDVRELDRKKRADAERATAERKPLREALRKYYHEQSEYLRLFRKPWRDQTRWADQPGRFKEILEEWRVQKRQLDELRKSDDYEAALGDLGDKGTELEAMWEKREELIRYARTESRRADRSRVDAEEEVEAELVDHEVRKSVTSRIHDLEKRQRS